ncbi:hypothetical protein [Polymorphum gilvum]|uniref:Uncharacterized protein n=1 Tax=Polymorphum gilvum (strain LMG 25793 / CGMCC 1.9160 / SL003B-26A1) TaxID=991905 RepID=F2J3W9_POLGS|nr:hypothetical protein [Polymorphum gilvum]ADZ68951.1 hypothetical protein SL003B_0518 [Polymorphum gilvum SL003B-26A1]
MALNLETLAGLTTASETEAWAEVIERALAICGAPLDVEKAPGEVTRRDRAIGELDHFLSSVAWELWPTFTSAAPRNADKIVEWWLAPYSAKAVLILDGLSLREMPWLVEGARARGFVVHTSTAYGAEIPSETNAFAKALGFGSRSQLQNNGGSLVHRLAPAKTECIDLPWKDCLGLIDASPNWVFWHQWPDSKLHDGSGAGQGLDLLTRDIAVQLTSDDFWEFVERLATGRRLVITSDHGYAATGLFFDAAEDQAAFLKGALKSGRLLSGDHDAGPFVPPVALQMESPHGKHLLAVGRWKWKSQGGYPTLAHGGLSLLEMLCPFVEITK